MDENNSASRKDFDTIGTRQPAVTVAQPPEPQPVTPLVLTGQNNAERMKEITDRLEAGIQALFSSDQYAAYLKAMSKFHNYSFNNTLLIVMQKPDASLIAGFNAWKTNFDRNVKKGEKGIKILAPTPFKTKRDVERIDPATQQRVTEQVEVTVPAFKPVTVFDVSQTEGKEIPDVSVDALTGDVEQFKDFFAALEKTSPVPVAFEQIESGANGYYHQEEKRIAIQEGMSELQTVKTAIHEIAHAKLHAIDIDAPEAEQQPKFDRRTREVQAESVAYAVCQHYGLDTSDYSFGYVAGWSSGKEVAELKASLETIRAAASEIISEIDGHLAELQQQREAADKPAPVMDNITAEQRQEIQDEVKVTLQMLVDADMQRQGEIAQGTRDAITTQGYELHDGQLREAQAPPLIDTPEFIAAELFSVARDFDPTFMQKYADRQDKQISATAEAMKGGDIFAMEAMMLHISQDENTPAPVRARAAELIRRMDDYKDLNNIYSIYQLKGGEETRNYRFESLDRLQARGLAVDRNNYECVYTAPLHNIDTLEDIYRKFNLDHPADFTGHSLSMSDVVVLKHGDRQTAHYCDTVGFTQVPEFLQERQPELAPDQRMTGETVKTPRGSFHVTAMTQEQMQAAGYGFHHSSDDGKFLIMANGTLAFAIPADQPEQTNPLKTAELSTEQNENMIDGRINNTPSVGELEAKVKAGETISLTDLAAAVKNERKAERPKPQKKPSIRAQLKADKDAQAKQKAAREKSQDRERE